MMKNPYKRLLTVLVMIICIASSIVGCSGTVYTTADYWPTEGWKTSTPEAQGMDSERINEMFNHIKDSNYGIHSVVIVRNGCLVSEGYFYPYKREYRHIINSATKSITSALVGIALEEGHIDSIDQKVVDFFPGMEIANLDELKKGMTVRNLLTMTAGLEWSETGAYGAPYDSNTQMWAAENQLKYFLDMPMKEQPGKSFYYTSGASHVLSAIIQKATGKTSLEYAKEKIFEPLGISDISWGADRQGIYSGSSRIFIKPLDLAKFGYLYLNKGKWEGRQLIPEKWIEESTMKQIDTPNGLAGRYGYGYQWWQNKFGGYSARGFAGQYLFVVPEHNLVAVFTGGLKPENFYEPEELMENYIIPSIKSPKSLEENKAAYEELQKTLESINKAPASLAVPALPEIAGQISGKTYIMDNNETYSFEFKEGNECIMHWFCDGVMYDVTVGLDGIYRENDMDAFYWKGMISKAGFSGSWIDENTFVTDLIPLEDCNTYKQEFNFDGSMLNARMIQVMNGVISTNANGEAK